MLTPHLEQLIWEGKAQFKTFATGASGAMTLPVQKNSFIVITEFTFSPFFDTDEVTNGYNPLTASERSTHTLTFKSKGGSTIYTYNFRNSFNINMDTTSNFRFALPLPVADAEHVDTYMIFKEDVYLDCFLLTTVNAWGAGTFAPFDFRANEPLPPNGYGTTVPLALEIDLGAASGQYLPAGSERVPAGIVSSQYREQMVCNVNGLTALLQPVAGTQGSYQYPLINISFVEIYQNPEKIKF